MLLRAGFLWSPPEAPVAGGWVRIQKSGIASLGSGRPPKRPGEEILEFPDAAILPALVNAHAHLEYEPSPSPSPFPLPPGERVSFSGFLRRMKDQRQTRTEADRMALIAENADRSLAAGVGTVVDHLSVGPPGKIVYPEKDPYPERGRFLPRFEILGGFQDSWSLPAFLASHPLAKRNPGWAPHSTYLCGEAVFKSLIPSPSPLPQGERVPRISIHVAESEEEDEMWRTGKGPLFETLRELLPDYPPLPKGGALGFLRSSGLLGPGTLLVHGNYLNDDEILEAGKSGASLVHCPSSHSYFKHRPFPWSKFKKAGSAVLLGTDSAATGGTVDLVSEIKRALETTDASPLELWLAATREGARVLGLEGVTGRLAPGYSADMVILDSRGASLENLPEKLLIGGKVIGSVIQGAVQR